jgi:hypothetical protein|tara:strand:- start:2089 stop:2739 length:651 start_codon:yes stop_codon:yes gene_type:complete
VEKRNVELDERAIETFKLKKIITIADLVSILSCSVVTVRRRLREWRALTSYNKNGRYYTIPSIPKFNKKGLWACQDVLFSKYGTLKNTTIELTRRSKKGLSHFELKEIIGLNPKCFMARFKEVPGLRKERHRREIIYFSADENMYKLQKENRFPAEPPTLQLPPDAETIIILLELVHNPGSTPAELSQGLKKEGHAITTQTIEALFAHYAIGKKKL